MSRRKYTTKFKTKVVLEALKEKSSLADLAQKYELPQKFHVFIYPNPFDESVTLHLTTDRLTNNIGILDTTGKLIKES